MKKLFDMKATCNKRWTQNAESGIAQQPLNGSSSKLTKYKNILRSCKCLQIPHRSFG